MRIAAVTTSLPSLRKPRLLGFIRVLRMAGHEVSVVATTDHSQGGGGDEAQDTRRLEELGVPVRMIPYALGRAQLVQAVAQVALRQASSDTALYRNHELARRVSEAVADAAPDVLHVERTRALSLVRYCQVPLVLDVIDPRVGAYMQYRSTARTALRVGLGELLRARLDYGPAGREEGPGLAGIPVLVASSIGRESLLNGGLAPDLVWAVPNPVFEDERGEPLPGAGASPPVLGMSGNLSYPPNVLGFQDFAARVLPTLRERAGARLVLIGAKPHPVLLRTARRAGVSVQADVSSVPDSIRQVGVATMVSPQRVSTGFPNRVIDAVYRAGVPIVCSPETLRGAPAALAALPVAREADEWLSALRRVWQGSVPATELRELQARIESVCGTERIGEMLLEASTQARLPRLA